MTERVEQRYCIKFCQKLGETIRKIQQVFGEDAMGVTQIKEWFNRFKSGRASAESDQRSGRPQAARSAAVVERVRNLVMADFLTKHGIPVVRHPPYSPDMAPCDFWLFLKLKTPLKGSRFETREEIMRNATATLNTIPKEDFQSCFQQWKDRWAKCVQAQGAYFEGD